MDATPPADVEHRHGEFWQEVVSWGDEEAPPEAPSHAAVMTPVYRLRQWQGLDLESKVRLSQVRIRAWHRHWEGQTVVNISGGKDSTVLLHLVRELFPDTPAMFADTGLEYPEIREFVRTIPNVTWVRPKIPFTEVLKRYGFPVVSKQNARFLRDIRTPTARNAATRRLRLTGEKRDGTFSRRTKLPSKWRFLIDAPFKISEQCCDVMKKEPFNRYQRETGRRPFIGTMAADSSNRRAGYLQTGCNAFEGSHPRSMPMAFWLEEDVWAYIRSRELAYSKIYDMGEERTGCMFCLFGIHMRDPSKPNRFQRMAHTHPKQYRYCMEKLGIREVLEFLGLEHRPRALPTGQPAATETGGK